MKIEKVGIMLVALSIIAMMFSGVTSAAQTALDLTVSGNAFSGIEYKMTTPTGLPYESNDYSLNLFLVNGKDVTHSHYLDIGSGISAETTLVSEGSHGVVLVDESVRKDVIGETGINENVSAAHCYSAEAGYSVSASQLNYESTAQVAGIGVEYTVVAAGRGDMRWTSMEYLASGEIVSYVNDTAEEEAVEQDEETVEDIPSPGEEASTFWTSKYVKEDLRVSGTFEFTGSYHSEFAEFPAPSPDEELGSLCPFSLGWD